MEIIKPFFTLGIGLLFCASLFSYPSSLTVTIKEISDDPAEMKFTVLCTDGTVWHCPYGAVEIKQKKWDLVQDWAAHQHKLMFVPLSKDDTLKFFVGALSDPLPPLMPYAYLDPRCLSVLPQIARKTQEGRLVLTDGTEWREESWFFSASKHWLDDDRILVTQRTDGYYLINLDRSQSYIRAALIAVHP